MAKSDDGQYELVLENRQVLVIFLFAALLCGIFFGLGFVVGQSSKGSPGVTTAKDASTPAERPTGKKSALSPPASEPAAEVAKETPATTAEAKGEAKIDAKPAETPAPAPAPSKPEEKPAPAPQPAAAIDSGQINLQVAAFSTHEEAEPMAALLKRKNFPVSIVAGTSDRLQHVMVGPYINAKDADAVKKRLESEGFKPIVKK